MKLKTIRGRVKSFTLDADTTLKSAEDGYDLKGYANKTVKDRYGEIVDATAFASSLASFNKNPVMLYMHDPRQLIGNFPVTEIRHDGLFVKGKLGHGFEPADTARLQIEQGFLKAMSIGFIPNKMERDAEGVLHIRDLELLEISLVSIPANQEALFQMDPQGKLANIVLLDEEQAKLSDEELFALHNGEAVTAEAIDASAAENETSSETTPVELDFSGISEVGTLVTQIGQALGIEDVESELLEVQFDPGIVEGLTADIQSLTSSLKAAQAKIQTLESQISGLQTTLVLFLESEINELERSASIAA